MTEPIKLPPLPEWTDWPSTVADMPASEIKEAMQAYATAAIEAALQSQDREDEFCVWRNDPETDNSWDTGCRQLFELYDGTPSENRMSFCCYCGKLIQEAIDRARRIKEKGE